MRTQEGPVFSKGANAGRGGNKKKIHNARKGINKFVTIELPVKSPWLWACLHLQSPLSVVSAK
jgi:hypothetical protein